MGKEDDAIVHYEFNTKKEQVIDPQTKEVVWPAAEEEEGEEEEEAAATAGK